MLVVITNTIQEIWCTVGTLLYYIQDQTSLVDIVTIIISKYFLTVWMEGMGRGKFFALIVNDFSLDGAYLATHFSSAEWVNGTWSSDPFDVPCYEFPVKTTI